MTALPWTDTRIESLKALWLSGLSATQVAAALGGVTRNAVIGKLHRLGVAGRASASPPRVRERAAARPRRAVTANQRRKTACGVCLAPAAARPEPMLDAPEVTPRVGDLAFLGRHECRWPIGDPAAVGFGFCGRTVRADGPYCEDHRRRAYRGAGPDLGSDRTLRRLLGGVA